MPNRTRSASFAFAKSDMPVRFGRYLLLKRRYADPIGEEFLAAWGVDEGVDQLRYVRGIYTSVAEEAQFVALFSEEARSLSRLASANVLRVIEVGVEGGIPFVACEHVEGVTLERLIELGVKKKKTWDWELSVHIVTELLRGLDYVHRREDILGKPMGMRHGDVRPANVIISFDGEVKLQNFGSALYFIADDRTNARVQTYRGIYAPPESSAVDEATVAGDLWGVGAILSTLLGGKEFRQHQKKPPIAAGAYPKEIDRILSRALHQAPERRYLEAWQMRDELLAVMRTHSKGHPPDDLARWTRTLGNGDRLEEAEIVKKMLGQDAQMSLGDTAVVGKLSPGTVLDGRYHLIRLLGEGGMGLVFEAEHLGLGRHVAVKVLHERVLDDDIAVERFRREARITGSLGHANIIGVSDFGVTDDGHNYLVMELLEGESLGSRIERETIDPIELARMMVQVCDGLEAAHEAGVVHRDLKPDNIFLTDAGPRIVDFGIAKRSDLEDTEFSLTRTGHICGTAEYLAPEQVHGQDSDYRCDIYAAGVIIYEALTGETPFRGRTLGETLHKVMADRVVPPRKRIGDVTIPKTLETICLKALSRNPDKRHESAGEMASAIRTFLDSECESAGSMMAPRRRPRAAYLALASVGLVALASGILLTLGLGRGSEEQDSTTQPMESIHDFSVARPTTEKTPPTLNALPVENGSEKLRTQDTDSPSLTAVASSASKDASKNATGSTDTARDEKDKETEPLDRRDSPSDRAHALTKRANRALAKMNFSRASELFERALILDPRISRAWYGLGRASFEQGRYEEAAKKLEYSLKLSPGAKRWRIYLGKVYLAMGKPDKAIASWRRVLKVDSKNETARKLLEKNGVKLDD